MTVTLTDEQRAARDVVLARRSEGHAEAVLTGAAGTGKTTLLRSLIDAFGRNRVVLGAPTGRAASRLRDVAGHRADTLHSLLYMGPDDDVDDDSKEPRRRLVFSHPQPPCEPGQILINDEASMIGTDLYNDVMDTLPHGAFVAWVGDREQLLPVNDSWGPDLEYAHANLTEVHRQAAGNPIIGYATATRQGRGAMWRNSWDHRDDRVMIGKADIGMAAEWAAQRYAAGEDATLLTWTHRVRERLNARVRRLMKLEGALAVGDRIVVKMNSKAIGVMNGEVLTVTGVTPAVRRRQNVWRVETLELYEPVYVIRELLNDRTRAIWQARKQIGREKWDEARFCHAWHGQCLTVHSSQASQWDHVGWVFGRGLVRMAREESDSARRLAYTAITRAAESLRVFDVR